MASQANLPHPWELKWSTTKSRFYFYNPVTKTSQWKSPVKGQPAVKTAAETVKVPNIASTKKPAITSLPQAKSTVKSGTTNSAQTKADDAEVPKKKKRKKGRNSSNSATKFESPAEKKQSFFPRVLRLAEPSKLGKQCSDKSSNPSTIDGKTMQTGKRLTKKLNDENLQRESKLSFEFRKKSSKIQALRSVVEKLENDSASKPDVRLAQVTMKENELEEEEEDMEVEYSPEVQIIFQEIQGVREEMKNMDTQEVTSDVQMIVDNIVSMPQCPSQEKLWFVLDTNLFLEDAHLLRDLKDQLTREFCDGFVFVIPWVVIQEIDHIKDKNKWHMKKLDLGGRARAAVNMIHKWLEKKDPTIIGQNPRDAASTYQVKDGFTVENNDDKILHCCLQYQDKYSSSQVALLTLDKNLRNKGMVLGINTFSKETLNKWLRSSTLNKTSITVNKTPQSPSMNAPLHSKHSWSTPHADSNSKSFSHTSVSIPRLGLSVTSTCQFSSSNSREWDSSMFSPTPRKVFSSSCNSLTPGRNESLPGAGGLSSVSVHSVPSFAESAFVRNERSDSIANFLSQQMVSIESLLLDGLSTLLEISMKDAYKDLWEDILIVKKPWSIIDVLMAINKHWVAVFKSFWAQEFQFVVQDLSRSFQTSPDTIVELSAVLDLCRRLWSSFDPKRWDVQSSIEELTSIKKRSLFEFSKIEESLKYSGESETCVTSALEGPPSFRSSVEMESCTVSPTASTTSVVGDAATPCSISVPTAVLDPMVSEVELQGVYECFDAVLKHVITLRDLVRDELLSSIDRPNRPIVLESFIQLGRYVCAIHDQYERVLSENKNVNNSDVYFDLLSTLSSFAQQYSIQVSPIMCRALRQFFQDETKRAVVEIGLSQIKSMRSSIIDCRQLLTPAESWHLFHNN